MKPLHTHIIFFALVIALGIIAVYPQTQYQPFLLQGDHGRDLYQYQLTAQGALPYQDFETSNGPLMFYYYALFLKIFGGGIQSVLVGYAVMIFFAGIMIFLISRQFLAPSIAALSALWYWAWRGNEFFYTFNHIGALVFMLATAVCAVAYISNPKRRFFIIGVMCAVLCFLIRPDMGLASLVALGLIMLWMQKSHSRIAVPTLLAGAAVILALTCLPWMRPYLQSIHPQNIFRNMISFLHMRWIFCRQNILTLAMSCLFLLFSVRAGILLFRKDSSPEVRRMFFYIGCMFVFCLLSLMEYFLGFRFFRWVWASPFMIIIMFGLLQIGFIHIHRAIKGTVLVFLTLICLGSLAASYHEFYVSRQSNAVLRVGPTQVYMAPDQIPWIATVSSTARFIQDNVKQGESVLPMIYDPIYAFLTQKPFPGFKYVSFFGARADRAVDQIERNQVDWIILSNRGFNHNDEDVFGVLGKDFGVDLVKYLADNYRPVHGAGPWDKRATQIYNHATRVLRRKTPFQ